MNKWMNALGEEFKLQSDAIDKLKEHYGKDRVYFTQYQKSKVWSFTLQRTPENSKAIEYIAGLSEVEAPLYDKVAFSMGYVYGENQVKKYFGISRREEK